MLKVSTIPPFDLILRRSYIPNRMTERALPLSTDLYELAMAAAYFDNGIAKRAIFDLFVRRLPAHRSYLVTAGLEQALDYLTALRFSSEQIDYVRRHPA